MSRPGDCWLCGVDPSNGWTYLHRRVWCDTCLDGGLSLAAAVIQFPVMQMQLPMEAGAFIDRVTAERAARDAGTLTRVQGARR